MNETCSVCETAEAIGRWVDEPMCRPCAEHAHSTPNGKDFVGHGEIPFGECGLCDLLGIDQGPEAFASACHRSGDQFLPSLTDAGPYTVAAQLSDRVAIVITPGYDFQYAVTITVDGYEWDTIEAETVPFGIGRALRDQPTAAELAEVTR